MRDVLEERLQAIETHQKNARIHVQTLGSFQVWREGIAVSPKEWGRSKTVELFEFLITNRHRKALHKEQILDRLWEEDLETGDPVFKVALHGINKVLEPNRKSHADTQYITRQGLAYQLNLEMLWVDADALEAYIAIGNQALIEHPDLAQRAFRKAIDLHSGIYLPDRLYEDWPCDERERLQVLTLGAMVTLSELLLHENPLESVRLTQQALLIDPTWEDAYRIQMQAYFQKGNRPMALKTYEQCEKVLKAEFGITPLPETRQLYQKITMA
ncbi:MAG: BTAD domain-containing putative transcriptional regulator [Runella sp.]